MMTKTNKSKIENIFPTILNILYTGLGQLIQGRVALGIGLMLAFGVSIILCFVLIGFITTPVIWLWAIYDSYNYEE